MTGKAVMIISRTHHELKMCIYWATASEKIHETMNLTDMSATLTLKFSLSIITSVLHCWTIRHGTPKGCYSTFLGKWCIKDHGQWNIDNLIKNISKIVDKVLVFQTYIYIFLMYTIKKNSFT